MGIRIVDCFNKIQVYSDTSTAKLILTHNPIIVPLFRPVLLPDGFHPSDIERIKTRNIWLQRFLEQHDSDEKAALEMLWDTCKWRKEYGANGVYYIIYRVFRYVCPNVER